MLNTIFRNGPVGFLLKKIISSLLLPLPIGLALIFFTIIALLLGINKPGIRYTGFAGCLIILLFSLNITAMFLLNGLQDQYPPLLHPPEHVDKIVVLGGGLSGNKSLPPSLSLNAASLSRLIEGVRLFKILHKSNDRTQLILSGGRVFQSSATIAGEMRNTATLLGVPNGNIALENGARDTHEEAERLKKYLGNQSFILVTSAYHMPRAMKLFKQIGTSPIPAPTQFVNKYYNPMKRYLPYSGNLLISDTAIHEYLGLLWAKICHQISTAP